MKVVQWETKDIFGETWKGITEKVRLELALKTWFRPAKQSKEEEDTQRRRAGKAYRLLEKCDGRWDDLKKHEWVYPAEATSPKSRNKTNLPQTQKYK